MTEKDKKKLNIIKFYDKKLMIFSKFYDEEHYHQT